MLILLKKAFKNLDAKRQQSKNISIEPIFGLGQSHLAFKLQLIFFQRWCNRFHRSQYRNMYGSYVWV